MDLTPIAPTTSMPRRPTVPVPATVAAFATHMSAAADAARATRSSAPDARQAVVARSTVHGRAAVTLGAMLRAGAGLATTTTTAVPATTPATAPARVPTATTTAALAPATTTTGAAPVAPDTTVAHGHGALAGRLVTEAVDGRVTSRFGPRVHPIHGGVRDHHGLDVAAPTGTPVRSVTDGTVVGAGDRGGYGLVVEVDHGDGVTSRYAHLSTIDVAVGDVLDVGEVVGEVGSTGASTGPHLHLEVRVDGDPVDPEHVLGG